MPLRRRLTARGKTPDARRAPTSDICHPAGRQPARALSLKRGPANAEKRGMNDLGQALSREDRSSLQRALSTVRELMTTELVTLRPEQPLSEAVTLFSARQFRHILVTEGEPPAPIRRERLPALANPTSPRSDSRCGGSPRSAPGRPGPRRPDPCRATRIRGRPRRGIREAARASAPDRRGIGRPPRGSARPP